MSNPLWTRFPQVCPLALGKKRTENEGSGSKQKRLKKTKQKNPKKQKTKTNKKGKKNSLVTSKRNFKNIHLAQFIKVYNIIQKGI